MDNNRFAHEDTVEWRKTFHNQTNIKFESPEELCAFNMSVQNIAEGICLKFRTKENEWNLFRCVANEEMNIPFDF